MLSREEKARGWGVFRCCTPAVLFLEFLLQELSDVKDAKVFIQGL